MESVFIKKIKFLTYCCGPTIEGNLELVNDLKNTMEQNPAIINCRNDNGDTALMICCRNTTCISNMLIYMLVDLGADINLQNKNGYTALMIACMFDDCTNSESIGLTLIKLGANLNLQSDNGSTALMLACIFGNEKYILLLVDYGANLNLQDLDGRSALMSACVCLSSDLVLAISTLINSGSDLALRDRQNQTALMLTMKFNNRNDINNILAPEESKIENKFQQLHL